MGQQPTELVEGISFSEEVLVWVTQALRKSHADEGKHHAEAIVRLQWEHRRIQDRIDAMYEGKLDGRIDGAFLDRKAAELRSEQCRLMRDSEAHRNANQSYIEEGIKLLKMAQRAYVLIEGGKAGKNENWLPGVDSSRDPRPKT